MSNTTFDYSESDDWVWGYGATTKNNEYVINISGGGDGVSPNGFEDWVIKNIGGSLKYYIRHGGSIPDNEQKGKKLVSCPEGNYVSFQDNDYEMREDEMDFEWLEEELEGVIVIHEGSIDPKAYRDLEKANEFLKNIAEEQTKLINKLKDCSFDEYQKLVGGENKLIKEWFDLKNEIGELTKDNDELGVMADAYGTLKSEYDRQQKDSKESFKIRRKLEDEIGELTKIDKWAEDWWKSSYDSFEDAIVGEYGDQSVQAKKYGFGVFKEE